VASDVVQSALLAQSINEYYLSAFDHALVVVGVVFGVVGVIVPSGIAYFQSRQAKHELAQIKLQIAREVAAQVADERRGLLEAQASALSAFGSRSDSVVADLEERIRVEVAHARAATLHVQAVMHRRSRNHSAAFRSATKAGFGYVLAQDFHHLRRVVEVICLKSLQKLHQRDLEAGQDDVANFERLLESVEMCDHKGAFTDLVVKARKELVLAKARVVEDGEPA